MHIPSLDEIKSAVATAKIAFKDAMILAHAVPVVKSGIAAGRPALEVLKEEAPEALTIIEDIANIVAPGSGTAIQIAATVYAHSRPMTRDEEEAWFKQKAGQGW